MTSRSGCVTGEPERKRQRRLPASPSQSSSESSGVSSTSSAVSSTSPSSADAVSRRASNQAEIKMTSTPTDPHNLRGVRSREGLQMLQGDQFAVKVGVGFCERQKKWILPRKLLTSRSPYFARMSSEKKEDIIFVWQAAAFQLFAQWLYLGELDFDDVNVSSETLVKAWNLGDEYQCPAFKDHVMAQLIKSHHERGIKPQTLRDALEHPFSGPKLRKWAIDQFHAKITYGYTGYDDQKEDDPSDKGTWKRYAEDVKVFGQNFLKACLDAGQGVDRVKKPWENGQQYMEALSYAEIGVYKAEGRSTKAEATLTKAEGR